MLACVAHMFIGRPLTLTLSGHKAKQQSIVGFGGQFDLGSYLYIMYEGKYIIM